MTVEVVSDIACQVGEGAVWSVETGTLLYVDIPGCTVYEYDPEGPSRSWLLDSPVGCVAVHESGAIVVALPDGFHLLHHQSGDVTPFCLLKEPDPRQRFNDGAVDSEGRFWAGTLDQIIGIKDPCLGPLELFRAIQMIGDRFIWLGNKRHDPGVLHLRYQMGIQGFTSGQLNFMPEPELQMHEAALRQDWDELVRLQALVAPLERVRRAFDDTAMVKAAMDFTGLAGGEVRPPRRNLDTESRTAIAAVRNELAAVSVVPA